MLFIHFYMKSKKTPKKAKKAEGPIKPDMIIADVVRAFPETIETFFDYGIHCVGCGASGFETIEQGVGGHGIDPEEVVKALNATVAKLRGEN